VIEKNGMGVRTRTTDLYRVVAELSLEKLILKDTAEESFHALNIVAERCSMRVRSMNFPSDIPANW